MRRQQHLRAIPGEITTVPVVLPPCHQHMSDGREEAGLFYSGADLRTVFDQNIYIKKKKSASMKTQHFKA